MLSSLIESSVKEDLGKVRCDIGSVCTVIVYPTILVNDDNK